MTSQAILAIIVKVLAAGGLLIFLFLPQFQFMIWPVNGIEILRHSQELIKQDSVLAGSVILLALLLLLQLTMAFTSQPPAQLFLNLLILGSCVTIYLLATPAPKPGNIQVGKFVWGFWLVCGLNSSIVILLSQQIATRKTAGLSPSRNQHQGNWSDHNV